MRHVVAMELAIAPRTGATYMRPHKNGWGSSMSRLDEDGLRVKGTTLPDLLNSTATDSVSLVKMDVEGAETLLLPHVGPFCAERKIPLLIEVHQPMWRHAPFDPACLSGFSNIEGEMKDFGHVLCT